MGCCQKKKREKILEQLINTESLPSEKTPQKTLILIIIIIPQQTIQL